MIRCLNFARYERFYYFMRTVWFLAIAIFLGFNIGISHSAQGQLYFEDFGDSFDCSDLGNSAAGFDPGNGLWAVFVSPLSGPIPNRWFISNSTLGGSFINDCTQNCFFGGQRTLHIGNGSPPIDQGAVYEEQGAGGISITNTRAESPVIDCSGSYNNTLTVRFAHSSFNANDFGSIVYTTDGVNWTNLQDFPNSGNCFGVSMIWDELTIPLPAAANNNSNVQIGFVWTNDDLEMGVGLRASLAIDFLRVDAGPAPDGPSPAFSVVDNNVDFCEQTCIDFISETTFGPFSTGAATATYAWEFPGAVTTSSAVQNPTGICYNEPGVYDVSLTVTDNLGTGGPITQTAFINVQDCGPTILIDIDNDTPCSGEECVNLTSTNSSADINPASWVWTFTSEDGTDVVTSNQANPTNICLNQIGNYDLTVSATNLDNFTETIQFSDYIEVLDCTGPEVAFTVSQQVFCVGTCIQFTDESTSSSVITEWNWTLPGGQAVGETDFGVSTQQNPEVCYDAAGSYWAVLSASDAQQGATARPDSILITVDDCTGPMVPGFSASDTLICAGDCVDFQNQSLGFQTGYTWIFSGINQTSTDANPQVICYETPGLYDVTLIVENGIEVPAQEVKTDYITVENCINPPVPRISVSQDTICAGKCVDFFDESTGLGSEFFQHEWIFAGAEAGSETSTAENPTEVCYNSPGTYDVVLKVIRPNIPDSATQVFTDAVVVVNTPECRPQIFPSIPDTICAGDCAFFSADFIDADSVRWTFTGGNPETSTAFEPGLVCFPNQGEFLVVLQAFNESGEAPPVFQTVFAAERPPLNAGPDITINAGAVIELTAGLGGQVPNGTFTWQPFDQVDNFSAQTVQVSPDETTAFIVYYDQDSSCTAVDTVNVTVNFIPAIGVPNSFSPNGDGRNDVLYVLGQGIARLEFKIFNRYGQLVFETRNQSEGWDGLFNEKELNAGTFVYTLEVTFSEGNREVYTGDINLVR